MNSAGELASHTGPYSGRSLSRAENERRKNLVSNFLLAQPGASRREIAEATGLTIKQVSRTMRIAEHEVTQTRYPRRSECHDLPKSCKTCEGCLGLCANPKCGKPVRQDQSRVKVMVSGAGKTSREAYVHLGCKE